jgi:hypothetical protein
MTSERWQEAYYDLLCRIAASCGLSRLCVYADTVGLGDTFLAGTLLVLGAEPVMSPNLVGPSSIPIQPLKD